jgi:DNA-binding transcriptional MerR regulator
LRSGAPEPETRIGGRRIFSEADIERLEAWYAPRRQAREGFRHA